jgi:hypothetical protein
MVMMLSANSVQVAGRKDVYKKLRVGHALPKAWSHGGLLHAKFDTRQAFSPLPNFKCHLSKGRSVQKFCP